MDHSLYYESLLSWLKSAVKNIYPIRNTRTYVYGPGYNGWGVQTNQKALAAFSIAAADKNFDRGLAGMSREQAMDYSLGMFRYSINTHIEGRQKLNDGEKWGHTWISGLGIERMMHAVDVLEEFLDQKDKDLFKKVLVSEANWILDNWPVEAEVYNIVVKTDFVDTYTDRNGKNRPESNIWNGAILLRTALLYPDEKRVEEYIDKGTRFLVNSISVDGDKNSRDIYNGKTVKEMYVGSNFLDSFALDHHGYLNVGYMAICLSNIAMIHFAYRTRGLKAPEVIYRNAEKLWRLIKTFTFPDGRLIQLGGDSRVRYCYCQDYILPTLLLAEDAFGDGDVGVLEAGWVKQVVLEQKNNADGSYLSDRCGPLEYVSPLYFTRLESDRAASISMGYVWRRAIGEKIEKPASKNKQIKLLPRWDEPYHGACFVRGKKRIASWVWRAAEGPTGLCLPPDKSDMAEWRHNMFSEILPSSQSNRIIQEGSHQEKTFDGGFMTFGEGKHIGQRFIAENEKDRIVATQEAAVVALPDDSTMIVMQYARSAGKNYFKSLKGMFIEIPNDIFNQNNRKIFYEETEKVYSPMSDNNSLVGLGVNWLNIDECFGILASYGGSGLELFRHDKRQIGMSGKYIGNEMLYCEEICMASRIDPFWAETDEVIVDLGFIVKSGICAEATSRVSKKLHPVKLKTKGKAKFLRSVYAPGANNKDYVIVANFGSEPEEFYLDEERNDYKLFSSLFDNGTDRTITEKMILPKDILIFEKSLQE
jgi:hypothetical protein